MAFRPIRAVGLREQARKEKVQGFEKGWYIEGSKSPWVAVWFLVPKPGVNKWRLALEYQYWN